MTRTWTIEVGGTARNYKNLKIERRLKRTKPLNFSALIEYATDLSYFDLVELKRDGIIEWRGFLEEMEIEWDKDGRYLRVGGRDTSVIAWKKYGEGFSNMHKDTRGFFGSVNANELIKLLLRTPKSDAYDENNYPNNKEGWGLDAQYRLGDLDAYRTGSGNPNYCKLRRRGYGWRNSGNPFASAQLVVDAEISRSNWTAHGASPYLDDEEETNYIDSNTVDGTTIYSFGNIPTGDGTPTSVERVTVTVVWKPEATWWWWLSSECWIYISPDGGTTWYNAGMFWGKGPMLTPNPYRHFSYDVSNILNTVDKVNAARIKLVNKSSRLKTLVTQAYLMVGYTAGGDQSILDWFAIPHSEEEICGIYIESRMDDDSYPRNYEIVSKTGVIDDFSSYAETDPNGHITAYGGSSPYVDFNCYQNESAYLYRDYGADQIEDFDWEIGFEITSKEAHNHLYCPFLIGTHLEDMKTMKDTAGHYFIAVDVYDAGAGMYFTLSIKDTDGFTSWTSGPQLSLSTRYYIRIVRSGITVYLYIYDDESMTNLIHSLEKPIASGQKFQYRFHAITWNEGGWSNPVFSDGFNNSWSEWTSNGGDGECSFDAGDKAEGSHSYKAILDAFEQCWARKEYGEKDEMMATLMMKLPDPNSEDIVTGGQGTKTVNAWSLVNQDFTHVNTEPWLHDDDGDVNYISETAEGLTEDLPVNGVNDVQLDWAEFGTSPWIDIDTSDSDIQSGGAGLLDDLEQEFTFTDLPVDWTSVSSVKVVMCNRGNTAETAINYEVYIHDGSSWNYAGTINTTSYNYIYSELDISSILDTVTKVNAAKVYFKNKTEDPWYSIRYCKLHVTRSSGGSIGHYDEYYSFADLSKYLYVTLTSGYPKLHIKARLYAGTGGSATSITLRAHLWDGTQWVQVGSDYTYTTTSYVDVSVDVSSILNTLAKINDTRLKITIQDIVGGGDGKGGIRVTYAYLEIQGTGYWGTLDLIKIFDKDTGVCGSGNPTKGGGTCVIGACEIVQSPTSPNIWYWRIWGYADVGGYWEETSTSTMSTNVWIGPVKLWVKTGAGDGFVKLLDDGDNTIVERLNLDNDGKGKPDSVVYCMESLNSTSGTFRIDDANLYVKPSHSNGKVYGITSGETVLVSEVTNNTYRDIIHSWNPVTIDNILIRITAPTADKTWAISQVYIYKAEREEFRPFQDSFTNSLLTGDAASEQKDCAVADGSLFEAGDIVYISDNNAGETNRVASISVNTLTMENNLVNTYTTADNGKVQVGFNPLQYIAATTFDSSYSTPIGPLNIPRGRVIDQIESVLRLCEASYIPYEWWLAYDGSNTFHVDSQRGSDLSATISFIKGTNLGGTTKISGIADTVQRVKIMGQGEGKKQETASSEWINSFDDMVANNTFFEDIISEKSIPDVETATVVGNIIVTEEGPARNQIILNINNDSYDSMAYDVGDIVTVTDALTATSGTFKIYNIIKRIDGDGEKITMVVDSSLKDEGDEWHEVYRRLKMLEISEAAVADWTGEANKEGKISSEKAITSFFEKTAKNDEDSQKRGQTDPNWFMDPDPTAYTTGSAQVGAVRARPSYYSYANNMRWIHSNDWMKFMGPDGAVNDQLLVELRGSDDTGGGSDEYDVVDPINVELSRNPKLVVELKLWEPTGASPTQWKDGDFFDIGLYSHEAGYRKGFFFRIKALGGSLFKIYAVKNEGGTLSTDDVETLIRTIDASDQSNTYKYRLEIIIEADNRYAIFNVYDMDEQQEYPPSVVYIGVDTTMVVRPLCMYMDATGGASLRAIVYIYKFRTEWEKVQ